MGAESFIAKRLQFKGRVAIVAIAISFFVIVLAESISQGFRSEINSGIAAMTGDVVLSNEVKDHFQTDNPLVLDSLLLEKLLSIEGVESVEPSVVCASVLRPEHGFEAVALKASKNTGDSLGISIPTSLAAKMAVQVGDSLSAYFMSGGFKTSRLVVSDIYDSPLASDLTQYIYADIRTLQAINDWGGDEFSTLDVKLEQSYLDPDKLNRKTEELAVLSGLAAQSSRQLYPQLYEWLDLIDFNVYAIILLMSIVAGFNMISGLLIMIFRNISTIGTLKTMGMNNKSIASVFLRLSAKLVAQAMIIGNGAALLFCLVQGTTHIIKLNPANYYVSWVPVSIDISGLLIADAVTFVVIMLLLLLPTLFISKIDPSLSVKQR